MTDSQTRADRRRLCASWLEAFAGVVAEHRDLLTELDSAIGDADHGSNMDRGMTAVVAKLAADETATPADAAQDSRHDPGQHRRRGQRAAVRHALPADGGRGRRRRDRWTRPAFAAALRAGLEGVVARGKAEADDKTMYDALAPRCDALDAALATAARRSRTRLARPPRRPTAGRDATMPMLARKGRARYLGERSVGPPGPGRDVGGAAGRGRRADSGGWSRPMTGIVVVSHSRALAEAAVALAARDGARAARCRIEVAAGLDDGDVRHRRDRDHGRRSTRPTTATASSC